MDDKKFDNIIKNKVDGFSSPEESDWSQFSSKLEEEEALHSDKAFDEKMSSVFADFEEPYQPSHWAILKEKLEIEEYIRTRLYLIKGVELSILIMIYMGFSSMFNPLAAIQQRLAAPVLMASQINSDLNSSEFSDNKIKTLLPLENEDLSTLIELRKEVQVQASNNVSVDLKKTEAKNSLYNAGNRKTNKPIAGNESELAYPSLFPSVLREEEKSDNNKAAFVSHFDHDEQLEISDSKKVFLANLQTPLKPIEYSIDVPSQTYGFVKLHSSTSKVNDGIFVGVSASFNADIIDSPKDNVYPNSLSYKNFSEGYSVGFGVINRFGNWDLGIGARYSQQAYSPRQISETTGGVSEGTKTTTLEKIAYDVVSLPLNVNYRLLNKDSWNVFAMAGLSLNAIGTAAYVAQEEVNRRTVRRFNILDNNQVDQDLDYLSQKDFDLGVFEGGSLLDNLYLSGSIGTGVEKQIGTNTFLSLSGQYRHHLFSAELGPNDDKIHSFVWTLGAKYKI